MLDSPLQDRCRRVSGAVAASPVGKPEIPPSSPSSRAAEDQTSKAEKDVRPKLRNSHRAPFLSETSTRQAPRGANKTTNLYLKSNGKLRASRQYLNALFLTRAEIRVHRHVRKTSNVKDGNQTNTQDKNNLTGIIQRKHFIFRIYLMSDKIQKKIHCIYANKKWII